MVALGNFSVWTKDQQKPEIKYDTFVDNYSLKKFNRPNVTRIYESFNLDKFNWSQSYIKSRFINAEENAKYTDYLVFLLQEEVYKISETDGWQGVNPKSANGSAYDIKDSSGYLLGSIPKMPDAGENAYFLALLKAWHALCNRLNKKSAIIGCPIGYEPRPDILFETTYTKEGVKYIAENYDMFHLYKYPKTGNANKFGYRAKEIIDYWKKTAKFKGLINYNLDTYFGKGSGSTDYNTIYEDFKNAADNGADIISCYPYKVLADADTKATARMLQIANEYQPSQCNNISCKFTIN